MKRNIYVISIILFCTMPSFGQNSEQTNQIILKLKTEVEAPGRSFCNKKSIHRKADAAQNLAPGKNLSEMFGCQQNRPISVIIIIV